MIEEQKSKRPVCPSGDFQVTIDSYPAEKLISYGNLITYRELCENEVKRIGPSAFIKTNKDGEISVWRNLDKANPLMSLKEVTVSAGDASIAPSGTIPEPIVPVASAVTQEVPSTPVMPTNQ